MSKSAQVPFIINPTVFHVGTMVPSLRKHRFSFEGDSLSVSTCPAEWTKIARLGGGKTWKLRQEDEQLARFLNMHDPHIISQLEALAISNGLVRVGKAVSVRVQNDNGEDVNELYATKAEALEQHDYEDISDDAFKTVETLYPTAYLHERYPLLPKGLLGATALNISTVVLADSQSKPELLDRVSGLWWNEVLDVHSLSAPRGCIFASKLDAWKVREL